MKDLRDTLLLTYRGLVMRVRVHRESSFLVTHRSHWGYDVCIDDARGGVCVWGPLHHTAPYHSHDAAEHAGLQRGRLAIDMLLGQLA